MLCSAAIKLQRPGREDSIWALDKLEDRMSEMRSEIYSSEDVSELSFTTTPLGNAPPGAIANLKSDPFYEEQQQRFFFDFLVKRFYNIFQLDWRGEFLSGIVIL